MLNNLDSMCKCVQVHFNGLAHDDQNAEPTPIQKITKDGETKRVMIEITWSV